ncbi:hypothetical protein Pla52o_53690 [Novipirellula galeiformis]|uniref:Uncharacterized protein n=1 Tax=Novipirellula galeiformis TaxID=2528004 RepID=A0A5C6C1U9_9BACT|nr:hypothetical protein [Novipirellula galeiformis]TWU17194.1 hypothetical protein Pla52o_53690 [Novipirellula galeiformis]
MQYLAAGTRNRSLPKRRNARPAYLINFQPVTVRFFRRRKQSFPTGAGPWRFILLADFLATY